MDASFGVFNGSRYVAYPLDLHTARARVAASAFGNTFRSGWIVEVEVAIGERISEYVCTIWPGIPSLKYLITY